MKKIALIALSALTFSFCHRNQQGGQSDEGDTFHISGSLKGLGNDTIWLMALTDQGTVTDTAIAVRDSFSFSGKCPEPKMFSLLWHRTKGKLRKELFVERGSITISGNADSAEQIEVSGSSVQKKYDEYLARVKKVDDKMAALDKQELQALNEKKDTGGIAAYSHTIDSIDKEKGAIGKEFIAQNPGSVVSPFIALRIFGMDPRLREMDTVYGSLDSVARNSYYGKQFKEMIVAVRLTAIGSIAPLFTMNDTSGHPVSLADYKGKVVMIDFWASWCHPCREENPNVVRAYHKFHPKGLEILGISLDEKHNKWVAAIQKDKLAWQHVSDLKGWANVVAKQYAVRAIPANYLIDKDGKILAHNLYGDELVKKLQEVLK